MDVLDATMMQPMNDQQRMYYATQMNMTRKDPTVGVLLAFFLGGVGAHRFYMGEVGLGILYAVFFWTAIPAMVAVIECFFMPGRVRRYNEMQALRIAAHIRIMVPA